LRQTTSAPPQHLTPDSIDSNSSVTCNSTQPRHHLTPTRSGSAAARVKSLPPIIFPQTNSPANNSYHQDTKAQSSSSAPHHVTHNNIHFPDTLQVNETPSKYSSASISVPPSPKNKSLSESGDGASPTPSVASFASYHHTPVRATKKGWSPRKKKGGSASDLPAPGDYNLNDDGHSQALPAGGTAAKVASPKHKQQEKNTKGGRSYSPNVLKKFQAVKSGLSFVNHLKFNQE